MKKALLIFFAFAMIAPACVPKSRLIDARNEGFADADRQCLALQAKINSQVNAIQVDLASKNERLRRFNQLNEDGTLRTKKSDDSKGWDDKNTGEAYDADILQSAAELLKSTTVKPLKKQPKAAK